MQNLSRYKNNFDFIRFVAAMMVLHGHSYGLTIGNAPKLFGRAIHDMGVVIFFCISGYLISISWARSSNLREYLWKRSLRIFPALIMCVMLTACILGPVMSSLPVSQYFSEDKFLRYFYNFILYVQYQLPGLFLENKMRGMNGSFWTLPVEFLCYLMLALFALPFRRRETLVFAGIAVCAILFFIYFPMGKRLVFYNMLLRPTLQVIPFFFIGAVLARLEGKYIHFKLKYAVPMCVVLFIGTSYDIKMLNQMLLWMLFPYIILTFALKELPFISDWGKYGDFSYGVYLYAFPLQQTVIALSRQQATPAEITLMVTPMVLVCAFFSWYIVEKPALAMKKQVGWLSLGTFIRKFRQKSPANT